jgi:hypothetical protein
VVESAGFAIEAGDAIAFFHRWLLIVARKSPA